MIKIIESKMTPWEIALSKDYVYPSRIGVYQVSPMSNLTYTKAYFSYFDGHPLELFP
jgi:hypothetical protein